MSSQTAVLLVNLGTPNALNKQAIKTYLREFLLDPRVIDLPWPIRYLLVNAFIVPFRSKNTLEAYSAIWTQAGSPLLVNSLKLQQKLQTILNLQPNEQECVNSHTYDVFLSMRYGQPSIKETLTRLQQNNYTRITIVPLYPQYASASSGSVLEKCLKHLSDFGYFPKIICLNEFYLMPGYINSTANSIDSHIKSLAHNDSKNNSHILFSYHGIPKRQLKLSDKPTPECEDNAPCPVKNYPKKCYRAQCYATTRAVAKKLGLNEKQYSTAFQSRLGKLPWVKPYTDEVIKDLINKGVTNLTVVCPSFVSDCLETTEEIGIRLKQDWFKLGGKTFNLVPCLNDNDDWVEGLAEYIVSNSV